jgi:hypothetical protein
MAEIFKVVRDIFYVVCAAHLAVWFVLWEISFFWDWQPSGRFALFFLGVGFALIQAAGRWLND